MDVEIHACMNIHLRHAACVYTAFQTWWAQLYSNGAMVTTECSRAVVWPDSDGNDDVAEDGGSTAERAQPDSADSERGRTLTLGVSRRGMKRAVQLIWGNRVGQHMGVARYGRVRPQVFDQRSSLNPPTNIAAMHSSDKSKFVDACKVRCEKLPADVLVNWHKLDLNKDMNDVGYVVGQTLRNSACRRAPHGGRSSARTATRRLKHTTSWGSSFML